MFLVLFMYNVAINFLVFMCVSSCLPECEFVVEIYPPLEYFVYVLSCGRFVLVVPVPVHGFSVT
jgi:hypothetical protein